MSFFFFLVVWFFETEFLCATALVVLELAYFCLQSVSKFLMKNRNKSFFKVCFCLKRIHMYSFSLHSMPQLSPIINIWLLSLPVVTVYESTDALVMLVLYIRVYSRVHLVLLWGLIVLPCSQWHVNGILGHVLYVAGFCLYVVGMYMYSNMWVYMCTQA